MQRRQERMVVATAAGLVFSRVFGLSLALPNFVDHYSRTLGASALWIGIAFGAHGLTMAFMQVPLGRLSDRIGRRPVLVWGTVVFVAGCLWAAFASSIWSLVAARLAMGLGAITSTAMAAVGETVPAGRRTTAMAIVGIPAGGAFMLGAALAALLYPAVGMTGIFLVAALVAVVAGLPLMRLEFLPPQPVAAGHRVLDAAGSALAAAGFLKNFTLMVALFHLPDARPQMLVPMLVPALLVVGVVGRLADRRGWTWQHLAFACVASAAALPAFFAAGASAALLAGGALFFAAHAVLAAGLPSQVSRVSGPSGGAGHGIQNVVSFLGTFAGAATAGAMLGHTWLLMAAVGAAAAACVVLLVRSLASPTFISKGT